MRIKNVKKVYGCRKRARDMLASGDRVTHTKRKERSDCFRDEARKCVYKFCHSYEGSNVDTESFHVKNVYDHVEDAIVKHPRRVWHEIGLDNRHKALLASQAYADFQKEHEGKEVCKEVFRQECCPCCVEPGPESCVDILLNALKHYMLSLAKAMYAVPVIKKLVEACDCPFHRQRNELEEDQRPTLESLLFGRTIHLVEATCCKAVKEPPLRRSAGCEPPSMIPWKCTTKDDKEQPSYSECGIEKKLGLDDCPVLRDCETEIKALEWKYALRQGLKKNGEPNMQLELTETRLPLNKVKDRLVEQLDKCRPDHGGMQFNRKTREIDITTLQRMSCLRRPTFSLQ
jgi:hypothetical protein